jgi:hypothetical protein
MKTSTEVGKIAAAFLKAQKNIGAASKGSANPFFKSKYADLGSVMEACKEALNNEGISVLQPVTNIADGKHAVTTRLQHESGEFFEDTMILEVPKLTMQDLGSAISYARRYGLQAIGFIPAEDDDGEKSMKRGPDLSKVPIKSATKELVKAVEQSLKGKTLPDTLVDEVTNGTIVKPTFNQNNKATEASVEDEW